MNIKRPLNLVSSFVFQTIVYTLAGPLFGKALQLIGNFIIPDSVWVYPAIFIYLLLSFVGGVFQTLGALFYYVFLYGSALIAACIAIGVYFERRSALEKSMSLVVTNHAYRFAKTYDAQRGFGRVETGALVAVLHIATESKVRKASIKEWVNQGFARSTHRDSLAKLSFEFEVTTEGLPILLANGKECPVY